MIDEPSPFADTAPKVRTMPQSSEAEQGLLCSIMRSPNDVLSLCLEKKITVEHFYTAAFGLLFAVLLDLWNARKPLEFIIIVRELQTRGQLEEVGGPPVISELSGYVGTAENAGHYIEIMKDAFALRAVIKTCAEHSKKAYEGTDAASVLSALHSAVTSLVITDTKPHKPLRQLAIEAVNRIEERRTGSAPQIKTGFAKLDDESPVRPGDFIVVAGRRKSGKSALVAEILRRVCVVGREAGAAFSLEMPDWQWVERMIANMGRISLRSMTRGILSPEERDSLPLTIQTLSSAPIDIFDSIFDLPAIVAKLRQMKAKVPTLSFAVVDYGQLVRVAVKKGQNREQEVAEVSRTLRLLASELNIAMVALSQLNEFGETRESKSLEQDCTAMWKVLEDLDDNKQVKRGCENNRTLWVPFQRHGGANVRVRMTFLGEYMQFIEDKETEEAELPLDVPAVNPPKKKPRGTW